jgi:vacuolar-type H+-ATPase subunit D/Vma8
MAPRAWFRQVIERSEVTGDPANDEVTVYRRSLADMEANHRLLLQHRERLAKELEQAEQQVERSRNEIGAYLRELDPEGWPTLRTASEADEEYRRRIDGNG